MGRKIANGFLKLECKHCLEVNVVLDSAHLHLPITKF
jgi:ribosomal protein S27E